MSDNAEKNLPRIDYKKLGDLRLLDLAVANFNKRDFTAAVAAALSISDPETKRMVLEKMGEAAGISDE